MAKYSFEFKMKVIKEYLTGQDSFTGIGKKYGLDHSIVRRWVAYYNEFGEEGLLRSRQRNTYTFEFKLHVVELYLTGEMSYLDLALKVGMSHPSQIVRWVEDYRTAGPDALRLKKKGRKRKMDKERIIHKIKSGDSDEQKELLNQLQEENLRLRIENAFLKEARRLRLEEENPLNEQRESSTASEENSN